MLAGGVVLEDSGYNRVHEMFQVFSATDSRANDYGEGFGNYWQEESTSKSLRTTSKGLTHIPLSSSMTVIFKPIAGILQVRKFLPLQFMPITIELSLVDNILDPIIYNSNPRPGVGAIADFLIMIIRLMLGQFSTSKQMVTSLH